MKIKALELFHNDTLYSLNVDEYGLIDFEKGFKYNLWIDTGICKEKGYEIASYYKEKMDRMKATTAILDLDDFLYEHAQKSFYHTENYYQAHQHYAYPIMNLADYHEIKVDLRNYMNKFPHIIHWVIYGKYVCEIGFTFVDSGDAGMVINKVNNESLLTKFLNIFHMRNPYEDEFLDALCTANSRLKCVIVGTENSETPLLYFNCAEYGFDAFTHGKKALLFVDNNELKIDQDLFRISIQNMLRKNKAYDENKYIDLVCLDFDNEVENIRKNVIFSDIHNITEIDIMNYYQMKLKKVINDSLKKHKQIIIMGDKVAKFAPYIVNRLNDDFALMQISHSSLLDFDVTISNTINKLEREKFINFIKSF